MRLEPEDQRVAREAVAAHERQSRAAARPRRTLKPGSVEPACSGCSPELARSTQPSRPDQEPARARRSRPARRPRAGSTRRARRAPRPSSRARSTYASRCGSSGLERASALIAPRSRRGSRESACSTVPSGKLQRRQLRRSGGLAKLLARAFAQERERSSRAPRSPSRSRPRRRGAPPARVCTGASSARRRLRGRRTALARSPTSPASDLRLRGQSTCVVRADRRMRRNSSLGCGSAHDERRARVAARARRSACGRVQLCQQRSDPSGNLIASCSCSRRPIDRPDRGGSSRRSACRGCRGRRRHSSS